MTLIPPSESPGAFLELNLRTGTVQAIDEALVEQLTDYVVCVRAVDLPEAERSQPWYAATCADCAVAIVFDPINCPLRPPKLCMACAHVRLQRPAAGTPHVAIAQGSLDVIRRRREGR